MSATRFGPGTVTFTTPVGTGTATSFEQEVKGGGITHEYEDIGESVTYLDGVTDPAGKSRIDALTLDCDFDLGSADSFYNYLFTNDQVDADFVFVPHTATAAEWSGVVRLQLPDGAVADEFGAKMSGTVELTCISLDFAPAGTPLGV